MQNLCDNCLSEILGRLNREDLYFLNLLYKNKTISALFSMSKEKILSIAIPDKLNIKNFMSIVNRIYTCGLIDINSKSRKKKYYITQNGIRLLGQYSKLIKQQI